MYKYMNKGLVLKWILVTEKKKQINTEKKEDMLKR